jgi:hypothetical protein
MNTTVNTEVVALLQSYRINSKFLYNDRSWLTENEVWNLLKENEAEILSQFGLPNERRYFKLLRAFGQTKNNDVVSRNTMLKQLEQAAQNFLLRPVLPMAQRLELARRNDESPLDILPEIGFTTHHFNVFLYSNLFLNNQATADEIINDLCLARDNKELPYIFNLALIPDYKNEPEYMFFKQSGFKFIDAYCTQPSFIPEPLATQYEKIEDHTYRNFELNNLVLNNIVFDAETGPTIFCSSKNFGKSKDIQIGLEFEQLYELLKSCESKGETIMNLITKKLSEKACEPCTVIDLDNFTGPLSLQHCNLKIFRVLEKTKDGKYEEYGNNFFMLEELQFNSNGSSVAV